MPPQRDPSASAVSAPDPIRLVPRPLPSFAELLRAFRLAAGLSQEELAERARLSRRGVSDLERGLRTVPRRETVALLADALGIGPEDRARLVASVARARARVDPDRPAVGSLASRCGMPLPHPVTPLVGRERDLAEVCALLGREEGRLVTLTGSGGVGKTRLALAAAAAMQASFPDGAALAELAALADPSLVPQVAAEAAGVRPEPGRDAQATLLDALRARRMLLVLDNCEHLLDACAQLADALLRWCPGVRVLATSREVLGLAGEVAWRVPSLAVPDPSRRYPARELAAIGAVRLFVERAAAARAGFALTERNAPAVAEVCRRLDGIPLALELAAARMRGLAAEQLAARLDDRFRLLTGGSRTALARQRTLRATLDWSHDLLEERERPVFRRLAVFAGGWTVGAAEAVCAGEGLASGDVLEPLLRLVDKSLVLEEGGRYRLLESVREYARERLDASGEHEAARARHAAHYLAHAEEVEREVAGGNTARLDSLDAECDNVRAALGHYALVDDAEALLRLAGALRWFWQRLGYLGEGRRWLEDALSRRGEVRPGVREQALREAGLVAARQGDFDRAEAHLRQCVAGYRRLGDRKGVAWALTFLANATRDQCKFGEAAVYIDEALPIARECGDPLLLGNLIHQQGIIAREEGDFDLAQMRMDEALAMARAPGGWAGGPAQPLHNLGALAEDRRDYASAHAYLRESLALTRQAGHMFNLPYVLDSFASLAALEGRPGRALRLAGAAEAWRERLGMPVPPMWRPRVDRTLDRARGALDDATIAAAWKYGKELTMEEAIAEALDERGEG